MTTKSFFFIIFLLLLISSVSAIDISQSQETEISHGEITYLFPANSDIYEAELSSTGIILDGNKLITIVQGGELYITFTSWSEEKGYYIMVESSVPQTILYKYVIDGKKYYAQINNSIFVDTYNIDETLEIKLIKESSKEIDVPTAYTEKLPSWGKRNAFFIIFDEDNVFFVKNSQILLFLGLFLVILVISIIRGRRTL